MSPKSFFFAGLPGSGKSTYLTAFWVYANGAPSPALAVEKYPESNQYLAELQEHWFNARPVPRTPSHSEREVGLTLKRAADGQLIDVQVPDLSGESFAHIWSSRLWSAHFQTIVDRADGCVFFVHGTRIEDGATLEQARQLARELPSDAGNGVNKSDDVPSELPAAAADFDITKCPTEVQIVECLQLVSENLKRRPPLRVAVVLSAWDLVKKADPAAEPDTWLKNRFPLLGQFLASNQPLFESAVFGISAQGGDYETEKAAIQDKDPYKRCIVRGELVTDEFDVTVPLQWLTR
jgi:hypothetical protein